jgi:probable HAF family extracellular repeat protein
MQDLGALGGDFSWANGINSAGQIVGSSTTTTADTVASEHAFIYSGGTMMDLNSLIPASSGWDLAQAEAINNSGWIVGYGVNSAGATDAFLLQPVTVVHNLGDANGDGRVDVNDLTIVLSNYGQTGCAWSQGSMDGDPTGTVDINDLTIVLANFGTTYGSASGVAAVPEPGTAALIAASLIGLVVCVWRKRTA